MVYFLIKPLKCSIIMVYKTLTILGGRPRAEGELLYPYGSLINNETSLKPSVNIVEKS